MTDELYLSFYCREHWTTEGERFMSSGILSSMLGAPCKISVWREQPDRPLFFQTLKIDLPDFNRDTVLRAAEYLNIRFPEGTLLYTGFEFSKGCEYLSRERVNQLKTSSQGV